MHGCVEQGIVERMPFPLSLMRDAARHASRVSRESRIFWRLQNISGPSTSRDTKSVAIPHTCGNRDTDGEEEEARKEGRKEGSKEAKDRE